MRYWLLALLLIAFPNVVQAQDCTAGSLEAAQIGVDEYDPSDGAQAVVRVSLRLPDSCDLPNLRIVPRDSNVFTLTSAGSTLLSRQSDNSEFLPRNISEFAARPDIARRLTEGDTVIFDLLDIDPGQYVRTGNYLLTIDFVSRNQTIGTLVINVLVVPTVRLIGASEAGNIDLDLGRLNDGATREQSIFFRSNAQVSLMVISDNRGQLVHERGVQFGAIPYEARLNGARVDPGAPVETSLGVFSGQLVEARFGVEIAPVQSAFGGVYRDVVTLAFTAL